MINKIQENQRNNQETSERDEDFFKQKVVWFEQQIERELLIKS